MCWRRPRCCAGAGAGRTRRPLTLGPRRRGDGCAAATHLPGQRRAAAHRPSGWFGLRRRAGRPRQPLARAEALFGAAPARAEWRALGFRGWAAAGARAILRAGGGRIPSGAGRFPASRSVGWPAQPDARRRHRRLQPCPRRCLVAGVFLVRRTGAQHGAVRCRGADAAHLPLPARALAGDGGGLGARPVRPACTPARCRCKAANGA